MDLALPRVIYQTETETPPTPKRQGKPGNKRGGDGGQQIDIKRKRHEQNSLWCARPLITKSPRLVCSRSGLCNFLRGSGAIKCVVQLSPHKSGGIRRAPKAGPRSGVPRNGRS